jgi:hypothetical protein
VSFLEASHPFAVVDLSVVPAVHALPVRFVPMVLAIVRVSLVEAFKALAFSHVALPRPFILASIWIPHDAFAMAEASSTDFSLVDSA